MLTAAAIGLADAWRRSPSSIPLEAQADADTPDRVRTQNVPPSLPRLAIILAIGLTLWLAPIALPSLLAGPSNVYTEESLFFGKMAVVTFGGA